jgi:hypothetical protein
MLVSAVIAKLARVLEGKELTHLGVSVYTGFRLAVG